MELHAARAFERVERGVLAARRAAEQQPGDALARVGLGSHLSAGRAQPSTPAMQRVAPNLRLELAQARDLLPASAADSADVRQQRTRAAAVESVLCSQVAGKPLRCAEHRLDGHEDVVSRRCEAEGCETRASFGDPADGRPLRCAEHMLDGHEDVVHPRCEADG